MDEEQIKRMLEEPGDDSRENSLGAMVGDLYNKKELSTLLWVWGNALVFLALAALSAILFFTTDQTKYEILYAAVFICSVQAIILAKIVCWQTMQRNRITREIKRLELRIAELAEGGVKAK